jgi:adenylosuccinate synthase
METVNSSGKGLVIIGTQFGDEGKGKIVDFFASKPYIDAVIRFNGGANAGHTVVAMGNRYALHLLPSGLVYGKNSYIGNGVVVDLEQVAKELAQFPNKKHLLKISERAQLVLPHHKQLDSFQEQIKGKHSREAGTTKRGIGPAYTDKVSRFGVRLGDLWDTQQLEKQINLLATYYQNFPPKITQLLEWNYLSPLFSQWRNNFSEMLVDTGIELERLFKKGVNVLFEGAQSTLLDIDHGIYPFNTSSNCIAAAASSGTGVGPQYLNKRIGVVKAYTSRVGSGPVIGEITDTIHGQKIQKEGKEYGTSTGRPRRIAWLDLIALKYACRINGLTGLAITKLDILGLLDEFEVIIDYQKKKIDHEFPSFPAGVTNLAKIKATTQVLPSWGFFTSEEWMNIFSKGWQKFPTNFRKFINMIEKETGVPIVLLSFGPDRQETFELVELGLDKVDS